MTNPKILAEHAFALYTVAALSQHIEEDVDTEIEAWETFVALVGEREAIVRFWAWQATLPREAQSDCDPNG